ncbi:hypothetical protein N8716_00595 [Pontimonas sp.]|nr:hypothetical protein [Pontimonas sp.]
MEMFWVTFLSLMAIVIGGYFVVTTGYKRMVAKQRSEHWVKHLTEIGTKMPYEDSPFELRHGEKYVLSLRDQMLAESRRGTRVSTRSTDAFTVALAKGFYYTAAAGQSVSPEPGDELKQIDTGVAHFTTHRVVFVGAKQTREWDFAKLLGTTEEPGGLRLMISVSNRQKTSGLASPSVTQISPGMAYQITEQVKEYGFDAAKETALHAAQEVKVQLSVMQERFFMSEEEIERRTEQWRKQHPLPDVEPVKNKKKASSPAKQTAFENDEELEPLAEIQVVGEMFYKKSFEALREELKTQGNTEHIVEVELRNDPDNEYSDSGKAVAVHIRNNKVGHVPEWLAPKVFDQLEPEGGTVTLGARLYLDYFDAKPQKNSVTVTLDSRLIIR